MKLYLTESEKNTFDKFEEQCLSKELVKKVDPIVMAEALGAVIDVLRRLDETGR